MSIFHGLSAFVPTPADAEGKVDVEAVGRMVEVAAAGGVASIGLLGSTGGYAYLTRAERARAVGAAAAALSGRLPLIVGVGALRTDEAEALARDARDAGADALLLAPMSYTPLLEDEVFEHFRSVSAQTALPLAIYNNPSTTRFTFSEALILRLAHLPGIIAAKMPLPADGDVAGELSRLRLGLPSGFALGHSGDWGAAGALLAGSDAWFSVMAGLLPGPALRLSKAARAGDLVATRRIDAGLQPLWAMFRQFGSFRVMYAIAELTGSFKAAPPRPILPLGPVDRARVEAAVESAVMAG